MNISLLADRIELIRYHLPNFRKLQVVSSALSRKWLDTLERDGIVRIELPAFEGIANYLEREYFEKLETKSDLLGPEFQNQNLFARNTNGDFFKSYGVKILSEISFQDSSLRPLFFNLDLAGVYYAYYRRQPYFRNQPILQKLEFQSHLDSKAAGEFHVDRLRQLSLMLLVSDVSLNDSHMEYVVGTHRRDFWNQGIALRSDAAMNFARGKSVFSSIGPKGTLYLFDASGVHRRKLLTGNPRKMLHCNLTTGHHLKPFRDRRATWEELSNQPPLVKNMFSKLPRL